MYVKVALSIVHQLGLCLQLAQKRFRERQRARSDDLEAQVKATSAQLEEMKRKQRALEARNVMLEKLIDLEKKQSGSPVALPAPEVSPESFGQHCCMHMQLTQVAE